MSDDTTFTVGDGTQGNVGTIYRTENGTTGPVAQCLDHTTAKYLTSLLNEAVDL